MIKKILLNILLFVCCMLLRNAVLAQDSSHIRISLLTCTPGDELYSTFGHSAIRIMDSSSVQVIDSVSLRDAVFNYGTFDFNDPDFYAKFIRGKLLYCLSIDTYNGFAFEYQMTNRGITEQVLNLSAEEKKSIIATLVENYKPGNRYYKYDFFLDNCTTRLRDLIAKNKNPHPVLPPVMPVKFRFRQAIHQYLDRNKKDWSKLGIDILLGAPCDAMMTTAQQDFLPDNLMIALDSTKNTPMVSSSQSLYQLSPHQSGSADWFTPATCFSLVLFLFIAVSLSGKKLQVLSNVLDGLLFFFTGALGVLLLFMWFGTDHSMTKTNYNLLWALPPHIIIAFFMNSKKSWVKKYMLATSVLTLLLLAAWAFLPQEMNNALLPLVILLLFRSVARYRKITIV